MAPDQLEIEHLEPWIDVQFARSSGPGGQNVNKVNTRTTLLFDFQACDLLTDAQKDRIARSLPTRMSRDGRLRVVSQKARTQGANRAAAGERLIELLRETLRRRKPRRPTRPSRAVRERRLREKRERGETKRRRQAPRPTLD